ncbi:site-specific integrase [Roseovarius sp. 10]|uniref:tyrosine-type recombinase/integrase n=1 Tax=Roseovarius sp. 10 TaxID=3080563 RepID=UPI002954F4CC|nr:site-specific integrase [Roseovarius sp. 10]MDV7201806.1 site-specific integrase [Roseovarius sp. 10]
MNKVLNWLFFRESKGQSSGPTLNQFFDEQVVPYLNAKSPDNTIISIFNNNIRYEIGSVQLVDLANQDLDRRIAGQRKKGLKPGTINKHIFAINRVIGLAKRWSFLPPHSAHLEELEPLRLGDYAQRFLSEDEIQTLLTECAKSDHPYLSLFVRFLLLTGARNSEARLAKWQHIDVEKKLWIVPKSKNGRSRRIILNSAALQVLRDIKLQDVNYHPHTDNLAYLFTNPQTQKPYDNFYNAWYKVRDRAGLENLRFHDLRHTYASHLINQGVSLYEVQTLLGHSSLQMTQRYAHLQPNLLQQHTEIMSNILKR